MKYRVHYGYIEDTGRIINAGIYEEKDLDLGIARKRSIVTAVDSSVSSTESPNLSILPIKEFNAVEPDVKTIKLEAPEITTLVQKVKINSVDITEVSKIKNVGKKTASNVDKQRKERRFESYVDLDKRVPLPFNRKWEDLVVIDFEEVVPFTEANSVNYI